MIYWCGGEDFDFPSGTRLSTSTDSSKFDATYSRCTLSGGRAYSKVFPKISNGWLHCFCGASGGTSATSSYCGITTDDGITGYHIYVTQYGRMAIYRWNGSWASLAINSVNYNATTTTYDLYFDYEGGILRLYKSRGANPYLSYTGDLSISGVDGFNRVCVYSSNVNYSSFSQVIVSDTDTRQMNLLTMAPTASGTVNDFTGQFSDINSVAWNDGTFMVATDPDKTAYVNIADVGALTGVVKAIKVATRSATNDDELDLRVGFESGGDLYLGQALNLTGNFDLYEEILHKNPITDKVFTSAELDGLQLAFRTVSTV